MSETWAILRRREPRDMEWWLTVISSVYIVGVFVSIGAAFISPPLTKAIMLGVLLPLFGVAVALGVCVELQKLRRRRRETPSTHVAERVHPIESPRETPRDRSREPVSPAD